MNNPEDIVRNMVYRPDGDDPPPSWSDPRFGEYPRRRRPQPRLFSPAGRTAIFVGGVLIALAFFLIGKYLP